MTQTSGEGVVGSIDIELDRKVYAPGDTVSGSVSLTALESIRSKERTSNGILDPSVSHGPRECCN
jgi:hypothetical protein